MKIYCLKDPRTAAVRYIGATRRPLQRRLTAHFQRAKIDNVTPKNQWLLELFSLGMRPIIEELEETDDQSWESREQFWIEVLGPEHLLNQTPGGLGQRGMSQETRKKISAACKGKNLGNKNAAGRIKTEEERQAIRSRLTGVARSDETKRKIRESLRTRNAKEQS